MRNKRGRPPLDPSDRSVTITLVIPGRAFDAYYARAQAARVTVPEVIRRALHIPGNKKVENSGE